jgi:hypothetical protein
MWTPDVCAVMVSRRFGYWVDSVTHCAGDFPVFALYAVNRLLCLCHYFPIVLISKPMIDTAEAVRPV